MLKQDSLDFGSVAFVAGLDDALRRYDEGQQRLADLEAKRRREENERREALHRLIGEFLQRMAGRPDTARIDFDLGRRKRVRCWAITYYEGETSDKHFLLSVDGRVVEEARDRKGYTIKVLVPYRESTFVPPHNDAIAVIEKTMAAIIRQAGIR